MPFLLAIPYLIGGSVGGLGLGIGGTLWLAESTKRAGTILILGSLAAVGAWFWWQHRGGK